MPHTFFRVLLTASAPAGSIISAAANTAEIRSNAVVPQPIDVEHLARQTLGDRVLQREVLGLFCEQVCSLAARIETASVDERRMIAHTIKGAAGGVGAFAVADCAARIEREPEGTELDASLVALVQEACGFAELLEDVRT